MNIAIFSDIHGNAFALRAVLEDIARHSPDEYMHLGDSLYGAADPLGAYELLQGFRAEHAVAEVRGNTDERLTKTDGDDSFNDWLAEVLPPEAREQAAGFALTAKAAGGEVLGAHGTPKSAHEYLLLGEKGGDPAPDSLVKERLGDTGSAEVVVVGHSHLEGLRVLGGLNVVNAGAVSMQKDGDPQARWLLLRGEPGRWCVSFMRVPYDVQAAAAWARKHAPDGEKHAKQLLKGHG